MSRTPEETARLAATVTVETPAWPRPVRLDVHVEPSGAVHAYCEAGLPPSFVLGYLAADLAEARAGWTYVEDGMPENGVSVLVTLVTRWGRRMSTVAAYYGAKELESCDDGRTEADYDEETDAYWAPPGWYEEPCSAEEVYPLDGVAVAWMPLEVAPETPAAAEEPRESEPAPAPARWRCEGCGWEGGDAWDHQGAMVHGYGGEDICGPVVPVGEAGS